MDEGIQHIAGIEGQLLSPEGAATYIAAKKLLHARFIQPSDRVVMVNTGSRYKYR